MNSSKSDVLSSISHSSPASNNRYKTNGTGTNGGNSNVGSPTLNNKNKLTTASTLTTVGGRGEREDPSKMNVSYRYLTPSQNRKS